MEKAIQTVKSVKTEYYALAILNFTLFVSVFVKELSMLYIVGTFVFIRLVFAFLVHSVLKITQPTDESPIHMVTEETQRGFMELKQYAGGFVKQAGDLVNGDSLINTVAYVTF